MEQNLKNIKKHNAKPKETKNTKMKQHLRNNEKQYSETNT